MYSAIQACIELSVTNKKFETHTSADTLKQFVETDAKVHFKETLSLQNEASRIWIEVSKLILPEMQKEIDMLEIVVARAKTLVAEAWVVRLTLATEGRAKAYTGLQAAAYGIQQDGPWDNELTVDAKLAEVVAAIAIVSTGDKDGKKIEKALLAMVEVVLDRVLEHKYGCVRSES